MDLSRRGWAVRGRARPVAYPVLGEEPCRDTAYVLGMAGPAWCSRCAPPEREGKAGRRGGQRMRRSGRNRVQDGDQRWGRRERKRKTVGRDGQADRQPREAGSPAPSRCPPRTPDPGLWLLGSHLQRRAEVSPCLRPGVAGGYLTTASGRGSPIPGPLLQACSLLMGKSQRRKHGVSEGDSGMHEARW